MSYELSKDILKYLKDSEEETINLIETLCGIPAPSHHEERRAEFVKNWLTENGAKGVYIDEALNVLYPVGCEGRDDIVVFLAHTDTVFPDMEPMPYREEDGRLYCPGVGDDTTNLAAMMLLAAYLHEHGALPACGVLFVADSCEEGLGNLKGCKAIMHAYGTRVKAFLSLDGDVTHVCAQAVGSARYRITARTKGGHSFSDFGNRSAIAVLAGIVRELYSQRLPEYLGSTTTYNVGTIQGGTSVNTIAQEAQMLYEFRSNNADCLRFMEKQMLDILKLHTPKDALVELELLGVRPCAEHVDPQAQKALSGACMDALKRYVGRMPILASGSTDCNIPLSMGIPSACFGVYVGEGEHTREEWVEAASIESGMKAAMSVLLNWFEMV